MPRHYIGSCDNCGEDFTKETVCCAKYHAPTRTYEGLCTTCHKDEHSKFTPIDGIGGYERCD